MAEISSSQHESEPLFDTERRVANNNEQNSRFAADKMLAAYADTLKVTRDAFFRMVWIAFSLAFVYSMRTNIFVLYARTFDNSNHIGIAISVYGSYLFIGINSLIYGIIGDRWRFDYLLIIASIFDVITFFIEATTESFFVLCIVYIIGGQPLNVIIISMIAKFLPTRDAKQIFGLWIQLYTCGIIAGPIIGGILSYYFGYRCTFYVAAIMASVLLLFVILFLRNVEDDLISKQFMMEDYYQFYQNSTKPQQIEHLFSQACILPLCLQPQNASTQQTHVHQQRTANTANRGRWQWVFLFCLFAIEGCCFAGENSIIGWYNVFLKDKYNSEIVISTAHISAECLFYIIAIQLVKKYIFKDDTGYVAITEQDEEEEESTTADTHRSIGSGNAEIVQTYNFGNKYVQLALAAALALIILLFFVVPQNLELSSFDEYYYTFLIYLSIYGMGFGTFYISISAIILEIEPKHVTGNVTGFRLFIRSIVASLGPLSVGLLWHSSYQYLWYTIGVFFAIAFCLICLVAVWLSPQFAKRSNASVSFGL